MLAASCVGIAVFLFIEGTYEDFPTALRHATFNVVSIATDSGLHTQDYSRWPIFAPDVDDVLELHRREFRAPPAAASR